MDCQPKRKVSRLAQLLSLSNTEPSCEDYTGEDNSSEKAVKEFAIYDNLLQQSAKSMSYDDCPLMWWKQYGSTVPALPTVARSYFGAQATSCSSKQLFSKAGYIVSKYRTSLKSDNVAMLTFLATNSE